VSALIQKSYPYLIVNQIFTGNKIELCISEQLITEYYEVLKRKKFSKYPDFVFRSETILADIERKSTLFYPKSTVQIISDQADNRLLELADESKAHFLIIGNINDFTMHFIKQQK